MSNDNRDVAVVNETLEILKVKVCDFLPKMSNEQMLEYLNDESKLRLTLLKAFCEERCCKTKEKIAWDIFYKKYFGIKLAKNFKLNIPPGYNSKIHTNIFIPAGLTETRVFDVMARNGIIIKFNSGDQFLDLFESHDRYPKSSYSVFLLKELEPNGAFVGISASEIWQRKLSGITFLELMIHWFRTYVENNGAKLSSTNGTLCTGTKLFGNRVINVFWKQGSRELHVCNVSAGDKIPNAGVRLVNRKTIKF
ncbi:MAG: hypothetical protein WCK37_02380 [Candidatus Falkowbacteria bacterium]